MRLGPLEIALIIVVVIAVAIIARIIRSGRSSAGQTGKSATGKSRSSRLWQYLNRTGIVMVVAGVAALIAAVSLFRWVLQSYLWAFILMALGFILVLFSRKKR